MSLPARSFRAFVGNLPWTIGTTELRQFASSFGPVIHSSVIFDKKTGLNKGYGFVTFGNRESFDAFIKGGNASYFLEGNHINVAFSSQSAHISGSDE